MRTLRFKLSEADLETTEGRRQLEAAASILRSGGTVALPTETVYGLGANALDPTAVAKIFAAKERPHWDPLIVHVANEQMLLGVIAEMPEEARRLIDAFWPGPLTLLLPRSAQIPDAITAGRPLVGVRMPAHPVASELIRLAGVPIAAPSANRFGHTSPTTAEHVLDDLDGRIDAVVDSGATTHGVESTVLDVVARPMIVYRPGAVSIEQIRSVAGETELFHEAAAMQQSGSNGPEALPSPGVGLRHYAPNARVLLVKGSEMEQKITEELARLRRNLVGILLPRGLELPIGSLSGVELVTWGSWTDPEELARHLFAGLRELDRRGCTVILCPVPDPSTAMGLAIADRLHKAARSENAASQRSGADPTSPAL